jgi:hypothetical protein
MCKWGTSKIVKLCKSMPFSKRTEVKVDSCIADTVQFLNRAGIVTIGSCCGHFGADSIIDLENGNKIIIQQSKETHDQSNS